ncbi:MAG: signal peptidase I [bacterium]
MVKKTKEDSNKSFKTIPDNIKKPIGDDDSEHSSFFTFAFEFLKIIVISLVIIIPLRFYLVQPFFVNGSSMEPSFSSGQYLIINEISYRFSDPVRGEVIVFHPPDGQKSFYIKRIIGLPDDRIEVEAGEVFINGEQLEEDMYLSSDEDTPGNIDETIPEGHYFVMGDNRDGSSDSRSWGTITRDAIIGKAWIRVLPFDKAGVFETPEYSL